MAQLRVNDAAVASEVSKLRLLEGEIAAAATLMGEGLTRTRGESATVLAEIEAVMAEVSREFEQLASSLAAQVEHIRVTFGELDQHLAGAARGIAGAR